MKERPILFSTPMVQAILAGKKTQSRRIVKHPLILASLLAGPKATDPDFTTACPYGQPGDVLWVRETWANVALYDFDKQKDGKKEIIYKATQKMHDPLEIKWKPSIFMFKKDSRIKLMIESISIEKLTDISEKDAKAEGAQLDRLKPFGRLGMKSYKEGFLGIWLDINGGIIGDEYVWVIKFQKL